MGDTWVIDFVLFMTKTVLVIRGRLDLLDLISLNRHRTPNTDDLEFTHLKFVRLKPNEDRLKTE